MGKSHDSHAHYMPTLDGVRALACLFVVINHLNFVLGFNYLIDPLGTAGVTIFFALSGFLMGTLYFGVPCTVETSSRYFVSRFSRITPAFYIAILVYWVLYMTIPDFGYDMTPVNTIRSFLFLGSEGVLWSIPPEIQFYAFFFLIWFSYERFRAGNYIWLALTALISLAFILTRDRWPGIMLPSKFHIFLLGFLSALLLKWLNRKKFDIPVWLQMAFFAACAAYLYLWDNDDELYLDIVFAGLCALTIMLLSKSTFFTHIFATPFMRLLGHASFSIYLFHEGIIRIIGRYLTGFGENTVWVQLAVASVLSIALPVIFYFIIEKPLNKKAKEKGMALIDRYVRPARP